MSKMKLIEAYAVRTPKPLLKLLEGVRGGGFPQVIYPTIRAIHADKVTRNRTLYPTNSLLGDYKEYTGLSSFTYPYPIPIIRDHQSHPGMFGGSSSLPYGRVAAPAEFVRSQDYGYVQVVSAITDPFAIDMILSERFLTVSIGCEAEEVRCSICKSNLADEEDAENCTHSKGEYYEDSMCVWEIGPIRMREISFVNVPSDDRAMIIDPSGKPPNADWPDPNITKPLGRPYWMPRRTPNRPDPDDDVWGDDESFDMDVSVVNERYELVDVHTGRVLQESVVPRNRVLTLVESLSKPDDDEPAKENTMPTPNDVLLTMGELYSLPETDPEFEIEDICEAKLSTGKRNALPDSAFCYVRTVNGTKVRKFPAQDASHTRNGLARLSQSNLSSSEKAKVKACLSRRAKRYGIKVGGKEGEEIPTKHLITISHEELQWAYKLYTYEATKEGIAEVLAEFSADVFWPKDVRDEAMAGLLATAVSVASSKEEAVSLLGGTLPIDIEPKEGSYELKVTNENFPVLMHIVEKLSRNTYTEEFSEHTEEFYSEPVLVEAAERDFAAIQDEVRNALNDMYLPEDRQSYNGPWVWIFAMYHDKCVVQWDGKYFQHKYELSDEGAKVEPGIEVAMVWEPVREAEPTKTEPTTNTSATEPTTHEPDPVPVVTPPVVVTPEADDKVICNSGPKGHSAEEPKTTPPAKASDNALLKQLTDQAVALEGEVRRERARTLAILRYMKNKDTSVEDLTEQFAKRSNESLEDSINDLRAELDKNTAPVIKPETVTSVPNPIGEGAVEPLVTPPDDKVAVEPDKELVEQAKQQRMGSLEDLMYARITVEDEDEEESVTVKQNDEDPDIFDLILHS